MDVTRHYKQHQLMGVLSTKGLPYKPVELTTSQRDTLTTDGYIENGMIIYNTTTDKFQGYAGGSWVDLH